MTDAYIRAVEYYLPEKILTDSELESLVPPLVRMDIREGNTVSNTVPIALKTALDDKRITEGSVVIAAGFGVGLSWGGCALFF